MKGKCTDVGISIHVPAWGTTSILSLSASSHLFQSTFPRGERPYLVNINLFANLISIHVPAWGTTMGLPNRRVISKFQSTFPRGERLSSFAVFTVPSNFNPRSRVGNDGNKVNLTCCDIFQSTFPRGERRIHTVHNPVRAIFQSTFPRGERHSEGILIRKLYLFQSTFPRGERLTDIFKSLLNNYFNPRSRVGNDSIP